MLRYFSRMRFRSDRIHSSLLVLLFVLVGCGDDSGATSDFAVSESRTAGIELAGNISVGAEAPSLLVFAFLRSGDEAGDEPVNVGIVDEQGSFTLSGLPPGKIGVTFLADGMNDGAIDQDDPITNLADPDQQLDDLQSGDRVQLVDIRLNFRAKRAVADTIEVTRAGDSVAPEPTATPELGGD
jgi:hypothetical protein